MARATKTKVVRRKPGRPQIFGERHPLGLRVTKETKERLDAAAKASGRSLSQEAETRLEHTFDAGDALFDALDLAYGRRWTGLLLALSTVAQITGTRAVFLSQWKIDACEEWDRDPYSYDQVVRGVTFLLEAFRPEGKIETPVPMDRLGLPASAYHRLGEGFARDLLGGLANPENKGPAWAFAYGANAVRERLSDLIPTMRVEPDSPIATEKTTSPKRG
jgi:hypothetical protein